MLTGTVKFFNEAKGFGFIKSDNGEEIFVHVTALSGQTIKENDKVSFETEQGKKGLNAVRIQKTIERILINSECKKKVMIIWSSLFFMIEDVFYNNAAFTYLSPHLPQSLRLDLILSFMAAFVVLVPLVGILNSVSVTGTA